ncbi:MAG: hypothetical protein FJ276_19315 [Planctomycetes bacterium]|nr:hypothetical protein [Planctomycetota bacterium]
MNEDTPDLARIPESLQPLKWVRFSPDQTFGDGDVLLVAVPVPVRRNPKDTASDWYYLFEIVRIQCDEDFFEVWCNDEPWDWNMEEVDWYVIIRR